MAFNFLEKRMEKTIDKIKKNSSLSEENIDGFLKEIRLNLLESDVNYQVVNDFIDRVKKESKGRIVDNKSSKSEELLTIIQEQLVTILGKRTSEWKKSSPTIVMMVGLQGSGKTTSTGKISNYLTKTEKMYENPLLVSLDVYRPAAMEQLNKLSDDLGFLFYADRSTKDVASIAKDAMEFAFDMETDLIIFDTAGRIQTDSDLMQELVEVKKIIKPSEIIFVADGLSGQEIINVAKEFDQTIKLTSAMITKLDSNAKGGAALSLASLLKIPIKFIGTGEKVNEIEVFHPDRMASRILGLGDLETLSEKAKKVTKESDNERMMRKMMSGKFDLDDLLISLEQVAKMGNLRGIASLMPGVKVSESQTDQAEERAYVFKILMSSMTAKERRNPNLVKHPKRRDRILKGSGRTQKELNDLLRAFEKSQKQMKAIAKYVKSGNLPPGALNGMSGF